MSGSASDELQGGAIAQQVREVVGAEVFAALLAPAACTVSIYLATEATEHDRRGPDARLRESIQTADTQLERRGLERRARIAVLEPARQFAEAADFARHRDPCLALFTRWDAPAGDELPAPAMTTLTLPGMLPDAVVVGPDLHIKPLLPMLAADRRFNILALSQSNILLLSATPFGWMRVRLDAPPMEAQAEMGSRQAAGAGTTGQARIAQMLEDPRRVASAVKAALGTDSAPIVLVADPQVAGHFVKQVQLADLHPTVLHLNPFALTEAELHAKVVELMQPELQADVNGVLEQIEARLGTAEPTVAIRLEEILAAAAEGRVDSILVAEDETLWGRFEPGRTLVAHGSPGPDDEDLLNQAAVLALRTGGRAFAVPRERMPRQVPAAATLRF